MENLLSSQTLQVNGVFKNSELLNHQPNKKAYSKPYLFYEKFVPQEFVAGCDIPGKYKLSVGSYSAIWLESNNEPGLQTTGTKDTQQFGPTFYSNDTYIMSSANSSGYYKYTLNSGSFKIFDGSGNNITNLAVDRTLFYSNNNKLVISEVKKNAS